MMTTLPSNIPVAVILFAKFLLICTSKEIPDLRKTRNYGPSGRFLVQRSSLEEAVRSFGLEGRVQLLSSPEYDSTYGEVSLVVQRFEDLLTWKHGQLDQSCPIVAIIGLPIVTKDCHHAVIELAYFTDATNPYSTGYLTNVDAIYQIDIETGTDYVTLKDGDGVMNITFHHHESCVNDETIAHDLDKVYGNDVRLSSYPAPFDWGCDVLGDDEGFCRTLEPFMTDILDTDGDVCTTMSSTKSNRCQADMEITSMTGIFQSAVPFLAETVPNRAFEAGWIEREHDIGIVYPCF